MKERVIICVDDEKIVLNSLKRELTEALGAEYIIETAEGGEETLDVVQELLEEQYEIPVVISDHIMPGMKGDELLQRIHAISPKTHTIMLTGQADMHAVTHALNYANLYRYIGKPWEKTDLCLTVKEAIHSYFQEKTLEEQRNTLQALYVQAQQEITERKRAEEALRKSEASMRAIVETAADGIITFNQQGLIETFNLAAEQIFGYQADEIIGQHIKLLIPTSAHTEYDRHSIYHQATEKESVICFGSELNGRHRGGRVFPVDFTVTEVRLGDQQLFTCFVRDITERRRAEQERLQLVAIQQELKIAYDIQQHLLPHPKPDWPGVDLICYNAPARQVSGDFYSYHAFPAAADTRKFVVSIGDVSGKGISAALLMATILSQFDIALSFDLTPAERLIYLDQAILPYTKNSQNCGLCYIELDCITHPSRNTEAAVTLHAVNAGGIPPYIKRNDGSVEWLDVRGLPLGHGISAQWGYQEVCVTLSPGEMVILTSDGVAEANVTMENMFGFERLHAAIAAAPMHSAEAMLAHLNRELAKFVGDAEPHDDITIVVARV